MSATGGGEDVYVVPPGQQQRPPREPRCCTTSMNYKIKEDDLMRIENLGLVRPEAFLVRLHALRGNGKHRQDIGNT